ncbi:amylosucrase [Duganella sp. BJB488]|uniref:alpha-amylase family glycosyl hydrolase n=1 Tax=unclassified Duganella TaxID=2636909 RepID=UPI000E34FEDE|nr:MULTISPECIES: alpha-amylase family glycosyl hydrolase [unclassified Duganella]RFP16927.1 amylosucrase [Duganella sp. BJB489]RFP20653.1 amylosucrase [Duganella sp. BJB488]RFP32293.1 amylosucrase [Duganella sp. BJB480]
MPSKVMSDRLLAVLPDDLRPQAAQRLAAAEPVLRPLLAGLYGERADFDAWLGNLMESLGALYSARPPELRALDAQRAAQPEWFLSQRMLGYCAYVQNFGGDLNGVAARIPYLRELGVSYLHLLPFLRPRAGENDGGFAVSSFDEVDPALGSNADLDALTTQLRAAGVSLCSDFILNHVADDHAWAQAAKAGDAEARAMFHVFPDRDIPDRHERTLGQVFPQVAPGNFTHVEALGGWVWTTFYPYQWDLNYANPAVFAEMAAAMLRLANRGIEVFRLDSTAFLWKREGTNSMNQPEAHQLLQALRAIVDIVAPGVLLKAEAIVPTRELPAYLGSAQAPECHIAYHSSLMAAGWVALAEQGTGVLREVIRNTPALPAAATWLSYVRCHDDIGWNVLRAEASADGGDSAARLARVARFFGGAEGSYAIGAAFQSTDPNAAHGSNGMAASLTGLQSASTDEERALALRRMLLLHGLALSFGALPVLYMGDELAMENDYSYLQRPQHAMDSRWLQRPVFDQQRWKHRYDVSTVPGMMHQALARLVRIRRRHDALAANAPRTLLADAPDGMLALARGDRFLTLMNFSGQPQSYALQGGWRDCVAEQAVGGTLVLEPYAMYWLERE